MSAPPERLSLGIYHDAVESPLLMMALEPWVWTILGLAGRQPHRRSALIRTAAMHSAHAGWMWWRLRRHPELVRHRRWIAGHVLLTTARCLVYPAVAPRHSYWQGKADDAAFFMQAWAPMVLFGAGGGKSVQSPYVAAGTGFSVGAAIYVASAVLNGEALGDLSPTVLRRILNYSVSSAMVGLVVHLVVTLLDDASRELAHEQEQHRATLESDGMNRAALDKELRRWQAGFAMLDRLQATAERQLAGEPELESMRGVITLARTELESLEPPEWRPRRVSELAAQAKGGRGVTLAVHPNAEHVVLEAHEAFCLLMFLTNAISNSVVHGHATEVEVRFQSLPGGRAALTVADNGVGLGPKAKIRPGHGLARVREILAYCNGEITMSKGGSGGAEVVACWSRNA